MYQIDEPRILLINPKQIGDMSETTQLPFGLALICAVLKENNYYTKGLNLDYEELPLEENLKNIIIKNNINIIGISSLSYGYNETQEILNIVKGFNSDIVTILGGGIIKEDTQFIFNSFENLDLGVIGEGEITIVELINSIKNGSDLKEVDGIIYHQDGELLQTRARDLIKNLDTLPFPDYDEFNIETFFELQYVNSGYLYYKLDNPRLLQIFSSRSCPFGCTFCAHIIGRKYRAFSMDYFFRHLDYVIDKYKINILQVADELFSVNKERLEEFCRRIKPYNILWIAQTRVDVITKEDLVMMQDAGCFFVSYGLEHVSNDVLKSMKKKITIEDIERILDITYKLKLGIQGNIIIGDPAETEETYQKAIQWVMDNKRYQTNLYPVITYPGTKIYYQALERGIIKDKIEFLKSKLRFVNLTQMSDDRYDDLVKFARDVGEFVRVDAKLVSAYQKNWYHKYMGFMHNIIVECGHCKENVSYDNFNICRGLEKRKTLKVCCKKCNGKFDINKKELRKKIFEEYKLNKFVSNQNKINLIINNDMKIIDTKFKSLFSEWKKLNITNIFSIDNNLQSDDISRIDIKSIEHIDFDKAILEHVIFIIPFLEKRDDIMNILELLDSKGIKKENIIPLNNWLYKPKK